MVAVWAKLADVATGLKSRSGGSVKPGFEGGQMPLQRRLQNLVSLRQAQYVAEVRLNELTAVNAEVVDLAALKGATSLVTN